MIQKDQEKKRETRRIVFEEDNHMVLLERIFECLWLSWLELIKDFGKVFDNRTFASEMNWEFSTKDRYEKAPIKDKDRDYSLRGSMLILHKDHTHTVHS